MLGILLFLLLLFIVFVVLGFAVSHLLFWVLVAIAVIALVVWLADRA